MQTQFTSQQSAAIFLKNASVALAAGAGCGKTFVLTQRFLTWLEPENGKTAADLHSLVAITFTDRAAREMRDRIRAACQKRLQDCPVKDVDHWLTLLRGLDSARISTIHSFCASLLRSQAVEAGLDPRFSVLEAAISDTLLRRVVRETFHELIETEDSDAVQLVVQYGLERTRELLRSLISQRFSSNLAEFSKATPESLSNDWIKRWEHEFVPKLIAEFRDLPLLDQVLNLISDSPSKNQEMKDRIAYLTSVLPRDALWQNPLQILETIVENSRVQGGGTKKDWVSEERQEQVKQCFEQLRKTTNRLQEVLNYRKDDVIAAAELACRAFRVIYRIAVRFEAEKLEQGALDFDDLLLRTRDLLRDNPDVRNRVAAGIRLLMVDEFQDTDPVQAEVVRNLCGPALTKGKLFMVGDRKQSIYRFRRADPTVFTTMSDEMPSAGQLTLSVNFRSQPAVLNFVNFLFAPAMPSYEHLTPFHVQQLSPTPAIEFLFATSDSDTAKVKQPESGEQDHSPKVAELRSREADWIARRIASLLDDDTPRIRTKELDTNGQPKLRPVQKGDIVILFRALSNVQEYESALRTYELDYYLVGGKAFYAQQEVFDLLNLCRYLNDCDDLIALVGILRSPFFNLSDDALQAIAEPANFEMDATGRSTGELPGQLSLHQTLYLDPPSVLPEDQRIRIRFAAEILAELRANKDRIPLSQLLTKAIEQTGYDAALLVEFLGERKLANLRKLVEMSRQFEAAESFTLNDFVVRLQTSVLEETDEEFATTMEESGDVIRLMSIHQSKGLEFPVVIVADIDRKGAPRRSDAVLHQDFGPLIKPPEQFGEQGEHLALRMYDLSEKEADSEETIRLFYVACTRAADYLILSAGRDPEKLANSPWMKLIESRFDVTTGLPKFDPLLGSSLSGTWGRETLPEILVHRTPCEVQTKEAVLERQDSTGSAGSKDPHTTRGQRQVSPGQLTGGILAAEPSGIPHSANRFTQDFNDLPVFSVSRLEAIDEELSGKSHPKRQTILTDWDREDVDLDLATSLGTIVHTVLEQVDFRSPSSWPDLLMIAANQLKESDQEGIVPQAQTLLSRFFNSPICLELSRAKTIHKEIDFLLPWPPVPAFQPTEISTSSIQQTFISGVIDLLVETDAGWHIFDYKTGDFPLNAPEDELLSAYELQLGIYAHAVEKWFGATPQKLSLIAFRPTVRRITLPWSPSRWDQIRARVDRALGSARKV